MNFKTSEENTDDLNANCSINEDNIIKCEVENDSLNKYIDIIITKNPEKIYINDQFYYFVKYKSLMTYTKIAGSLQKNTYDEESQIYKFSFINTKSMNIIPEKKDIEIQVKTTDEDYEYKTAICRIEQLKQYNLRCELKIESCPQDIIIDQDSEPKKNSTIFWPNTLFFEEFKRRTITIKVGELEKVEQEEKEKYIFNFINNTVTGKLDKNITFNLTICPEKNETKISLAVCNLTIDIFNIIHCQVDDCQSQCPDENDDIKIIWALTEDFDSISPDTLYYEGLIETTTTINMTGMIIKKECVNNILKFIITDNVINGSQTIEDEIPFEINLTYERVASCLTKIGEKSPKGFDIDCEVYDMKMNEEIEIVKEPIDDKYYFVGFKNKKTFTLNSGIISKIDNYTFIIKNNKYISEFPLIEKETIDFSINYLDDKIKTARCEINITEIKDYQLDIICAIKEDSKTISLLDPEAFLLTENITFNFIDFKDITIYSLELGQILKGDCSISKVYTFTFIKTSISKSLSAAKSIKLPTEFIINENNNESEEKSVSCSIPKNILEFNMSCTIRNYCPSDYYEINIKTQKINYNINKNSIYLDVIEDISSKTLKPGYINKINGCSNNLYRFSIKNNILTGNMGSTIGDFLLKLEQFENEVSCTFNINTKVIGTFPSDIFEKELSTINIYTLPLAPVIL